MISPFETAVDAIERGSMTRLPVRLVSADTKSVSRLEFGSLDQRVDAIAGEVMNEITVPEVLPDEESISLEAQLKHQSEQMTERIKEARSEAAVEARAEWAKELEERIAEERSRLIRTAEEFHRERAKYFAGVEGEVVKLALTIAERVLHREAKMDPLLLSGVVRVALEKIAGDSSVVMRIPVSELEMWTRAFAANEDPVLELTGGERMEPGECVLETNVGRVELGLKAQLEEIERGFFDLMQRRPA